MMVVLIPSLHTQSFVVLVQLICWIFSISLGSASGGGCGIHKDIVEDAAKEEKMTNRIEATTEQLLGEGVGKLKRFSLPDEKAIELISFPWLPHHRRQFLSDFPYSSPLAL